MVGVKQEIEHGELAFELQAEILVGLAGCPPLQGIDIGGKACIKLPLEWYNSTSVSSEAGVFLYISYHFGK